MSVSHRSSVSRRPVGGQANANPGQPSSPVTSHASKTTSVSPDIPYDIWVGPDIPFRPANAPTTPSAQPTIYNPSAMAEHNSTALENSMPHTRFTEPQPGSVELSSTGSGDLNNVPSWQPAPAEEGYMQHSTLEVVPETYFNNFWSPEPKAHPKPPPGPPPNVQNAPQSNVSSTGWAVASPEPQQGQSSPHPAPISQNQNQFQGNMSGTAWAVPPPDSLHNQTQNQSPSYSHANIQPRPGSTVSSNGWPVASPAPSPHQSLSQPASNVQHRPQSTVSSTGWAVASPEPFPNQHTGAPHYPPSEDLSPLSMPGMVQASAPPTQFSTVPTPSSTSSPMTTPSISGAEPIRRQSAAMNTPSRMPSNARPPVLNHNQPRSLESVSFASVCCQCSNAILYNTYYYNCTYCKLDICGTCFQAATHPWTHLPSMVRLNAQETKAGDRRQDKQCQSCSSMKHRRMDCDECPYSVCLSCYSNAAVPTHQHKSFKLKATPGLTLCVRRGGGSPCCTKPSFGHCGRCYTPWKPEEWMVQCKTCLFEFEEVVALCLQCDSEILSACRQSQHQMVSMKCRQKLRSEQGANMQASVECTECAIQFQSMTDISFLRHPHANYDFLFFTEDREQLFAAVYRSCKKKSSRTDTPLPPSTATTKCTYCNHNVPTNMIQSCLPCNTVKYCHHCYPIAAPTHHHGPSNFVSQRDILQTQLGGGWTQRKNSAARIWYHHTRTNTHSFDFPQSALGQPEPLPSPTTQGTNQIPIKPENHRRATTGGIPSRPTGPLPPGWEARKTPDGRRYYANHSTKQTSWQRPASMPRRPNAGQRHGSVPLQNHGEAVAQLTPEQKAAAKLEAQAKAKRQKIYTKIGTSVLRGVVSGVIS